MKPRDQRINELPDELIEQAHRQLRSLEWFLALSNAAMDEAVFNVALSLSHKLIVTTGDPECVCGDVIMTFADYVARQHRSQWAVDPESLQESIRARFDAHVRYHVSVEDPTGVWFCRECGAKNANKGILCVNFNADVMKKSDARMKAELEAKIEKRLSQKPIAVETEDCMMMCEGCTDGRHWDCGMQTWCQCDCEGPDGNYFDEIDPDAGFICETIEDDE